MPVRRNPAKGIELGYAEITAAVTGISTIADVTGLTITFTVGVRPVMVEAVFPLVGQVTSTGQPTLFITDGSNVDLSRVQFPSMTAATFDGGRVIKRRLAANTGAITTKVRAQTTAGTVSIFGSGTTYQSFIRAYEV